MADKIVIVETNIFERNQHGHIVLTFTGLDLTGAEEIKHLKAGGRRVSKLAKSCFLSIQNDSYDKNHRLVAGKIYRVALMPGCEIESDSERTTKNLQKRGMKHYGYGKPLAGLIPRVREVLSNKQMEKVDIWYAAALHDPISDSRDDLDVLGADRDDDGQWVNADWGAPADRWDDNGAFVFPISAS